MHVDGLGDCPNALLTWYFVSALHCIALRYIVLSVPFREIVRRFGPFWSIPFCEIARALLVMLTFSCC